MITKSLMKIHILTIILIIIIINIIIDYQNIIIILFISFLLICRIL